MTQQPLRLTGVSVLVCVLLFVAARVSNAPPDRVPAPLPVPVKPNPTPVPEPAKPKPKPKPWDGGDCAPVGAKVGGNVAPDGTEIQVDLPADLHSKNIAAKGLGCCVFRSLDHAARWQNIPALLEMPEWMVKSGIEGGGYPEKTKRLITQICKDRGLPEPEYIQVEQADHEILKLACGSGRMACVTYSHSPTGRYGGSRISHMVNCSHADDNFLAILDNNYIQSYEWMTPDEAKKAGVYEWIVILISPGPPPAPPKN